jgi:hypothetical protein
MKSQQAVPIEMIQGNEVRASETLLLFIFRYENGKQTAQNRSNETTSKDKITAQYKFATITTLIVHNP